jgi:hypothetical protein
MGAGVIHAAPQRRAPRRRTAPSHGTVTWHRHTAEIAPPAAFFALHNAHHSLAIAVKLA